MREFFHWAKRSHTKPNAMLEKADRPAHRVIPKSRFAKLETIDAVIEKLIGVQCQPASEVQKARHQRAETQARIGGKGR